jgi:hypothetical protein
VRRLQREVGAGRCPFRERPLTSKHTGRPRVVCFRADCMTEYERLHKRDSRKRLTARIADAARRLAIALGDK